MIIELTKQQQRFLLEIIDDCNIKGRSAEVILDLKRAIVTEYKEDKEEEDK